MTVTEHEVLSDRTLTCKTCGLRFVFEVGEQIFYRKKGLQNDPRRCRPCRVEASAFVRSEVTCECCGLRTTVPFRPRQHRPVYCRACYRDVTKTS